VAGRGGSYIELGLEAILRRSCTKIVYLMDCVRRYMDLGHCLPWKPGYENRLTDEASHLIVIEVFEAPPWSS
jgi:hypothetical protein